MTAPDQLIQGKVAGVQIINNSGDPGGATTVRIRGISSIRSGNQPLFVVDGVPLSGGSAAPGLGTSLGGAPGDNPLNYLNPSDIASMEVLKDASATAIFGSRGANGVVIINTKRGSKKLAVEYNFQYGSGRLYNQVDVFNTRDFIAQVEANTINGLLSAGSTNLLGVDDSIVHRHYLGIDNDRRCLLLLR